MQGKNKINNINNTSFNNAITATITKNICSDRMHNNDTSNKPTLTNTTTTTSSSIGGMNNNYVNKNSSLTNAGQQSTAEKNNHTIFINNKNNFHEDDDDIGQLVRRFIITRLLFAFTTVSSTYSSEDVLVQLRLLGILGCSQVDYLVGHCPDLKKCNHPSADTFHLLESPMNAITDVILLERNGGQKINYDTREVRFY